MITVLTRKGREFELEGVGGREGMPSKRRRRLVQYKVMVWTNHLCWQWGVGKTGI